VSLTLLVLGAITLPGVPRAEEAVELVDGTTDVEALIFRCELLVDAAWRTICNT
jgi:hypothetical protein